MRNRSGLMALVLIILFLIVVNKLYAGSNTLEEAINPFGTNGISVIHEEKNKKGSIVFSYISEGNALNTAVVRKNINGYKTVYSGVQGDIKRTLDITDMTYVYFPAIEKTELPIYFGAIGNPAISQVKLVEKKRNIEVQAKVIEAQGIRLWLVYMKELQGSEFDIIGLSKDNKEIIKIDGDIFPYYAEQKPFKGYK